MTKTRASACHGNVKQPPPFSSSLVGFARPNPEPPPAYAHSSVLIQNEFFQRFPESSNNLYPFHTVFPFYTARTLTPHETRDLINHPINCKACFLSVRSCSRGACLDTSGMTNRGILDPRNVAWWHWGHSQTAHHYTFCL